MNFNLRLCWFRRLHTKRNKDKDSAFCLPSLITIVWIINDWCVNITIKLSFPTCFSNRTACIWCSIIKADICSRCNINKHQHQLILWSAQLSMMMNLKTMRWCLHSVKHIKATYRYLMHSYFICRTPKPRETSLDPLKDLGSQFTTK